MAQISIFLLTVASVVLTALTVSNAFFQKKQFYPSVVYITKSSPSMAVMYIQGLVIAYLIFQLVRRLFFGQLRAVENEHLSERTWHAIMETCLAFTVFRDDFSPRFAMQFVFLLFVKSFHWISEDRVDFMERSPIITALFHCRMMSLLAFLSAVDSYFISHAYFTTLVKGPTVQIVFGFEYAVLMTVVLHVTIKYILHMHDLRNVHPWENKAVYLLYSELLINCLRSVLYVIFVAVMIRLHTFPLFSIRPLYLTVRAFHKAVNDVILSRRAVHAMNNLFPLASEQDLSSGDNICIICREEMTPLSGAKKLPCNHIFHSNCLRSWFQRQQSCPTCRTDILGLHSRFNHSQCNIYFLISSLLNLFIKNLYKLNYSLSTWGCLMQTLPSLFAVPAVFPFPPVPTFAGLTDEEIAAMEGRERAAVEARINCIRNIGLLLDAAAMQLQQYMSVVQSLR
ncbi:unnamed protein product [Thelazia callipaeda]|uniref:E3 ubiquitin-protein ligase hrd-1 n=1 Tax=Thelazia callipaeda TaxID=103827 RepID=A0A0N5D3S5_THECL|nr:unnamed protein product [Thelazia callipaeda]